MSFNIISLFQIHKMVWQRPAQTTTTTTTTTITTTTTVCYLFKFNNNSMQYSKRKFIFMNRQNFILAILIKFLGVVITYSPGSLSNLTLSISYQTLNKIFLKYNNFNLATELMKFWQVTILFYLKSVTYFCCNFSAELCLVRLSCCVCLLCAAAKTTCCWFLIPLIHWFGNP